LAACRAVLFAQLVDDPSSWPDRFPTEDAQDMERRRLHKVIEAMVSWEASNTETILNAARWEIARSVAWGLGEEPPNRGDGPAILDYLQTKAPPVYDPFSGGGSIPLEAQRLGLRAYGSDLNPVAVLIGKALVEIPPKFAGRPPVNPTARAEAALGEVRAWKGAEGLAEDIRYYGHWMRDEAEKRIGHLYPKATLKNGSKATVIAWLWARTVRSPDPAAKGAMVPLVSSFMLSSKLNQKTVVELVIDPEALNGWRFEVRTGILSKDDEEKAKRGTKTGRGSNFTCVLTGSAITGDWVKAEGVAGRMGNRLMAIVAEGDRTRTYVSPTMEQQALAATAQPDWEPEGDLPHDPRNFWTVQYGLSTFASLFTRRQLVALTTFSDLVGEARDKILADAQATETLGDNIRLHAGGSGSSAYADAVATYLAFGVDRLTDRSSAVCGWDTGAEGKSSTGSPGRSAAIRGTFSRQSIPMTWDFAEANVFSDSAANFLDAIGWVLKPFDFGRIPARGYGSISNLDAAKNNYPIRPIVVSTDPPYYDNIGYADLSDYFYVWLRHSLASIWPELFRRLNTPKSEELVATPYRHGGKAEAEAFFMRGMAEALAAIGNAASDSEPLAIYYAFKQSEAAQDGVTSAGWSSFLQAIIDSGLSVDGTWPLRTELTSRMIGSGTNALASSIVLVCRKRLAEATVVTRADFIRALKRDMPTAIDAIRKAGVGPVDMQQSVIGPGMGIFSRHAKVLEDDDTAMDVKTALAVINRVWEEIENELDQAFDAPTQVALAWFATYGFDAKPSGDLITLANAKNVSLGALFSAGVFQDLHGRAALMPRGQLPRDWTPAGDSMLTVWECVQHTARVLNAEDGGGQKAALLVAQMGAKADEARALAYRLFEIATQKNWSAEALVYNELAQEWPRLEDFATRLTRGEPLDGRTQLDLL
jgi:putative DNA methylase